MGCGSSSQSSGGSRQQSEEKQPPEKQSDEVVEVKPTPAPAPAPPQPERTDKTDVAPGPAPPAQTGGGGKEKKKPKVAASGAKKGEYKQQLGVYERKPYDFRSNPHDEVPAYSALPKEAPYTDVEFGSDEAVEGEDIEWKRPTEIRDNPVLFSDGTTRYDIGQGSAGTCWFLSMVAMLADRPELFHRVCPKDAWNKKGGYFYCYFWRFGNWERVVVDDYLPVEHETTLWGARSSADDNEMWPSLLEKAFARFHGNYKDTSGGQSGDAFLALTGGCSEYVDFKDDLKGDGSGSAKGKALAIHGRIKNAANAGDSMVTTDVPNKNDKKMGLVGDHAYSLTDATTITLTNGKTEHLVRIRNPWGNTEWTGPWSDGSKEWKLVPPGTIECPNKDDGEFWMSMTDYIKYFAGVTVNSIVPDFDRDGSSDELNFCTTIKGNWAGDSAGGFEDRIDCPKFHFCVDKSMADSDGLVPLVLQLCQKMEHRNDDMASIRVDLYKVLGERTKGDKMAVLALLGDGSNHYHTGRQTTNRFKVPPGHYACVPSTVRAGIEKDFLIRVYAPGPLTEVRQIGDEYDVTECEEFKPPDGIVINYTETVFGSWVADVNAGGQISNRDTHHLNPQIEFTVPDGGKELVSFTLMQAVADEPFPIGIQTYPLEDGYELTKDPSHVDYIYSKYEDSPKSLDGDKSVFMNGNSADISYKLAPGRYFALFHCDTPQQERDFAVVIRSSCTLKSKMFNVNP